MSINFLDPVDRSLQELLAHEFGDTVEILKKSSIGGGCINDAYRLETSVGTFFVKINDARRFPAMFEQEARGLNILLAAQEIRIPRVIGWGEHDAVSFLLLEYIRSSPMISGFWEDFGRCLAQLHRHSNDQFGLDHANYIGSLPQQNTNETRWTAFFVNHRLEPQCKMALDDHRIDVSLMRKFDALYPKLDALFPRELPSLLHGDLWSGNYMVDDSGKACIIDPAVYYGHREMDLAMTLLFGGFRNEFYEAYHEAYPLEQDWRKRMDLCNLYPLLVHVNLFGEGYVSQVRSILNHWV